MFISRIKIRNFRVFGADDAGFDLFLNPGLTALVGENDSGKTAVMDALRLVLGTRDQEYLWLDTTDFNQPVSGERADEIVISCTFDGLSMKDRGAFAEHLTYETRGAEVYTVLHITWSAKRNRDGNTRRFLPIEWRSGENGDGPSLDAEARFLLTATYLRPLRDAERAMSAGRGSRLSQILQHTKEIKETGEPFQRAASSLVDPSKLSVLGVGDYANHLLGQSEGIKGTQDKLNREYLFPLSFRGDPLDARIFVSGSADNATRLRQLLEKLEVSLSSSGLTDDVLSRGLGSNNLLFMACELLLLAAEEEGFPILLIEEPEAHLHPQRQLRLMKFLQDQVAKPRADGQQIQMIVTTHSPNLASDIELDNIVLIRKGKPFPMIRGATMLSASDYSFLERFLDVTKANLFFARGVIIVEGDSENILLPTLAQLVGLDLRENGVSVIHVGGIGLRRYANIFMRADLSKSGELDIPVACVTDMDVMPDCAPYIIGTLDIGAPIPTIASSRRKWRVKQDFSATDLAARRKNIESRANGQHVRTFVADEWTLEYDLAFCGLAEEVWIAAQLAESESAIQSGRSSTESEIAAARVAFASFAEKHLSREELASHVFARFVKDSVSKTIAAQHLAELLARKITSGELTPATLRAKLPPYIVTAVEYVSRSSPNPNSAGSSSYQVVT